VPDVILMDINLPGISGNRSTAASRRRSGDGAPSVVALSANAMPRDIEKGLEAGFFPLSHQTHQGQRVHGYAGPGIEIRHGAFDRRDSGGYQ
jgi:CheY-like chemotaxis protein